MSLTDSEIRKFLSSIQPFNALSADDLNEIVSSVRVKIFSKDETIFNEGKIADSAWVLHKGRVQVVKYSSRTLSEFQKKGYVVSLREKIRLKKPEELKILTAYR